jgi:hypothetical protein
MMDVDPELVVRANPCWWSDSDMGESAGIAPGMNGADNRSLN